MPSICVCVHADASAYAYTYVYVYVHLHICLYVCKLYGYMDWLKQTAPLLHITLNAEVSFIMLERHLQIIKKPSMQFDFIFKNTQGEDLYTDIPLSFT